MSSKPRDPRRFTKAPVKPKAAPAKPKANAPAGIDAADAFFAIFGMRRREEPVIARVPWGKRRKDGTRKELTVIACKAITGVRA